MKSYSLQRGASPAAGGAPALQRSASARQAPSPSPLSVSSSSSQYQSARASTSTANAPAFARHKTPSINCMAATSTDTPPATPRGTKKQQPKSASYSSMFSPRKLMQRASRAFRGGRSSRRKKSLAAAADVGEVDSPGSAASKGSDAESSAFSMDDQIIDDVVDAGAASKQEEIVPEKIIHEANPPSTVIHLLAPVAEEQDEVHNNSPKKEDDAVAEKEKEDAAAAEKDKEDVAAEKEKEKEDAAAEMEKEKDKPEKEAPPAPEDTVSEVDKIAVAKKLQREDDIKAEVVRRFQGCRVRTSTGKRSFDAETPRRRESARSNEAVEEARIKLLELRQVNKVKALVGAFETVMDDNQSPTAARKPRLNLGA
ncbi:myristoylated alanine-rich C-kinase substrate-like [Triticum dicoccoides]|uniref:myristoylated alanine-rich C-kinase substrate-like n=1 Tax=Triticum dicoccoides TaxID=85692 RepID=UPI00162D3105|nr:myristoylated alanine-rich C-kinase substrate-like [Triticum dicoccoides]